MSQTTVKHNGVSQQWCPAVAWQGGPLVRDCLLGLGGRGWSQVTGVSAGRADPLHTGISWVPAAGRANAGCTCFSSLCFSGSWGPSEPKQDPGPSPDSGSERKSPPLSRWEELWPVCPCYCAAVFRAGLGSQQNWAEGTEVPICTQPFHTVMLTLPHPALTCTGPPSTAPQKCLSLWTEHTTQSPHSVVPGGVCSVGLDWCTTARALRHSIRESGFLALSVLSAPLLFFPLFSILQAYKDILRCFLLGVLWSLNYLEFLFLCWFLKSLNKYLKYKVFHLYLLNLINYVIIYCIIIKINLDVKVLI